MYPPRPPQCLTPVRAVAGRGKGAVYNPQGEPAHLGESSAQDPKIAYKAPTRSCYLGGPEPLSTHCPGTRWTAAATRSARSPTTPAAALAARSASAQIAHARGRPPCPLAWAPPAATRHRPAGDDGGPRDLGGTTTAALAESPGAAPRRRAPDGARRRHPPGAARIVANQNASGRRRTRRARQGGPARTRHLWARPRPQKAHSRA